MKALTFGLGAALVLALAIPRGWAQERPKGRPGAGRRAPHPLMRLLDANHDGVISTEEIQRAAEALKRLDRNGDGKITAEELSAWSRLAGRAAGASGRSEIAARLKAADKNGDGKISKEEAPERLKRVFDRVDANQDGLLDASELKTLAQRLRGRVGQGSSRRGQGRR